MCVYVTLSYRPFIFFASSDETVFKGREGNMNLISDIKEHRLRVLRIFGSKRGEETGG
jgi:hypothetical protein